MAWMGWRKFRVVAAPIARTSPRCKRGEDLVEYAQHALARLPFRVAAQQVFLGDHLQNGADILRHAAVDEDEAVLQLAARLGRGIALVEDAVLRHEPAAADAALRVAFAGEHAFDELHARPNAARVLPAAAGAAEPFAEQRARQHQPALVLLQLARQRGRLAGRAHADADQRRQQRRRDRQTRAFGDVVDAAGDFQAAPRPDNARQQFGQALARSLDARAARCQRR